MWRIFEERRDTQPAEADASGEFILWISFHFSNIRVNNSISKIDPYVFNNLVFNNLA